MNHHLQPRSLLPRYLATVATLLFVQGSLVLLFLGFSITLPSPWDRAVRPDALHGIIHVVWALLIATGLAVGKHRQTALSFSLFYLLLALFGIVMIHPWGLLLDSGENLFHLLVGAIALYLVMARSSSPE